ncbi:MAG: CRISPR-associated endonuclease Cas2 [Paludibacteraceae bacterium]|nr:CRISPR-associated endonuclease Cas2 [Paludibacteraceae bacterium]
MGKSKTADGYIEALRKLKNAGLSGSPPPNHSTNEEDGLTSLEERIDKIIGVINQNKRPKGNMLFFVMYDIESNKVRYNIVKYLERQGCIRVQKSIFLADLSNEKYEEIRNDLTEVQSLYDNHDSILICPVSTELLKSMKVIGQNINFDVIVKNKNTLFF